MGWQDAPLADDSGEVNQPPAWRNAPITGEPKPQSSAPVSAPPEDIDAANKAFLANNQGFGVTRSDLSNRAQRVGLGMTEPAIGLGQLAAHATGYGTQTADAAARWVAQKEAEKKAEAGLTPEDWDYWAGAGNIASPVNFLPGAGIARVAGPAKSIVGAGLRGMGAGAGYGAMQPVSDITPENDYWSQKQGDIGTGLIAGGVTGLGAGTLAKAVSPAASKTAAQLEAEGWDQATIQHAKDLELAHKEGIRTTLGQTTGMQRGESTVGDVPFAGSVYRDRLEAFREDANRAALNRAVPPQFDSATSRWQPGKPIQPNEPIGTQGIVKLKRDFNNAYNNIHSQMSFNANPVLQNGQPRANPQFAKLANDLANLQSTAAQDMSLADSERLGQIIKNHIYNKIVANGGVLNGRDIQTTNSKLRVLADKFSKDRDPDNQLLGEAIDGARQYFSSALAAQNSPEAARILKEIDNKYAHFVRVRKAAVIAKNSEPIPGVFTGNQLLNADTQLNNSVGKGDIATGEGLYQDLAGAMTRLTPRIANSGSPERIARLALGHTLTGAAGFAVPIHTAATIGGLSAAYTNPAQRALNAAVTKRPPGAAALGRTLRTYGPTAGTRAITTGKVGQDQEPEMLPPVRVEQASGGSVHPHAQRLNEIEASPLSPEQKRDMRRKIIEDALRNP